MPPTNLFLDTIIQIERLLAKEERSRIVLNNIKRKRVFSSSFVFFQFKNTVIKGINFLQSILQEAEGHEITRLSDLMEFISNGLSQNTFGIQRKSFVIIKGIAKALNRKKFTTAELSSMLGYWGSELEYVFFNFWSNETSTFNIIDEFCFIDDRNWLWRGCK